MAFKRYIKIKGKSYGPYYYKSYRENGKVINKYISKDVLPSNEENSAYKPQKYGILAFLILALFSIGLIWILGHLSVMGHASLNIETEYVPGENLAGNINFNLKQGELIPANSMLILEIGNSSIEVPISELLENEKVSGDFFAEGVSLSGSGEGYGIAGSKIIYPKVDFELLVSADSGSVNEEQPIEQPETPEETIEEPTAPEEIPSEIIEQPEEITSNDEAVINDDRAVQEEASNDGGDASSSDSSSSSESEGGSVSGGGMTGMAISENEFIVSGSAGKGEDYVHILEDGQSAKIVPESVKVDGKEIGDGEINLDISGNEARISTEYETLESGFGEEYIGEEMLSLSVDISRFNIAAEEGELKVKLVYDDVAIAEVSEDISVLGKEVVAENITSNLSLLGDIPAIRIQKNGNYSLNLSEYFAGAERYALEVSDIGAEFDDDVLTLTPNKDFKGARIGKIIAYSNGLSLESNEFNILVSSGAINIDISRGEIKVGERVRWTQNITLEVPEDVAIELPKQAQDVVVKKIDDEKAEEIEGSAVEITGDIVYSEPEETRVGITGLVVDEEQGDISGGIEVLLNESVTEYSVEYYTDAPQAFEQETGFGKRVVISGPDELNYTDVLSFANISEVLDVGEEGKIRIHWVENDSYVEFDAYDIDGNGKLDYVEWITPHLSNQTFDIILITAAQHLDENRTFISDIYEDVSALDGNWSEPIYHNQYIRATFEREMTNGNVINFYVRNNESSNTLIEVYGENGSLLLASTPIITTSGQYDVELSGMSGNATTFDFKLTNADNYSLAYLEFDYIKDAATGTPSASPAFFMMFNSMQASEKELTDNGQGDEHPIQLNDYGTSTEKCSLWDCTGWTLSTASKGPYCSGGFNCSAWNGVTCSNYKCLVWSESAAGYAEYCSDNWDCLTWNGDYCRFWNCTAWSASTYKEGTYCDGTWNCTAWNGVNCDKWACNSWADVATQKTDYYCSGVYDCTSWNGNVCANWNCTAWSSAALARTDEYCLDGWNCTAWAGTNGNTCDKWACLTPTDSGTADNIDMYCDRWNCTAWDDSKKACSLWGCLQWMSSTAKSDSYCSGSFNCTTWKTFVYDAIYPTINFTNPTETSGITLANRNNIVVNVTANDTNLANITINLYNSTGLVNSTTSSTSPLFLNFTNLINGIYFFNATAADSANNRNSTETRNVTIFYDIISPFVSVVYPQNTTYNVNVSALNYSYSDTNPNKCWYSTNLGVTNSTPAVNAGVNFTGITSIEGSNTWTLYCNDSNGYLNSSSKTFAKDTIYPTINFTSPTETNGTTLLTRNNIIVNVTANDTNLANVTINLYNSTGLVNSTTKTALPYFVNFTNLANTIYYFNASATDYANSINSTETRRVNVSYDNIPPVISIYSPQNTTYSNRTILVNFTADSYQALWFNNGTANISYTTVNYTNAGEGSNTFVFYANDSAGNLNSTSVTFDVDTTYPTISIVSPASGANYTNATQLVNISTSGASYTWFFNGTGNETYTGEVYRTYGQGSNTLYAYANDSAGNLNSTSATFFVDSIKPIVGFVSPTPANNSILSQNNIPVNISVNETNLDKVVLRLYNSTALINTTISSLSNLFVSFTNLANGIYYINATANDTLGNENSTSTIKITLDITNPNVAIIYPQNISYGETQTDINYTASDIHLEACWYSIDLGANNNTITCGQNVTSLTSNEGNNTWIVWANDSAGNVNYSSVTFITDLSALGIYYVIPTEGNGVYLNRNNIAVNVTASNLEISNLTIHLYNATALVNSSMTNESGAETNLFANFTNLNDGVYHFNATAVDILGRSNSTGTRSVTIDSVKPAISLISPTDASGISVNRNNIAINASANDSNLQSITINIYNSSSGLVYSYNTGLGNSSLFVNQSGLADGIYYFNASALDLAGNINYSETRNITLETQAPLITINSPQNITYTTQIVLFNITLSENGTCLYSLDSSANKIMSSSNGFDYTATNSTMAEGSHNVVFNCNDSVGNFNSTSVMFSVDTIAPLISIISPQSITYENTNSVLVNISSDGDYTWFFNGTGNESYTTSVSRNYLNGTHTLYAYANDTAGNVNSTFVTFNIDSCVPNMTNTSMSDWINLTCSGSQMNQSSFKIEYDLNVCEEIENVTHYEYQLVGPILVNATWSNWTNVSCLFGDKMNQTRNLTRYDVYACAVNTTFFDYQSTESCDFCTPNMTNTTESAWTNQGDCKTDDLQLQNRSWIEYDTKNCGEVENVTYWEYQNISCNYCSENIIGSFNTTCLPSNTLTQYYIDINYDSCCVVTGFGSDCNINNDSYNNQTLPCDYDGLPALTIISPANTSYNSTSLLVNISVSDSNVDSIWYNWDGVDVAYDSSLNVVFNEGSNTLHAYANDSIGNLNTTSVSFSVDTVYPSVSVTYPLNSSYDSVQETLNYSASDLSLASCLYSLDDGATNVSITCGENVTGLTSSEGANTWIVWVNDSAGNLNYSRVTFFVDINVPGIFYVTPTEVDNAYLERDNILVNVTSEDLSLSNITIFLYNSSGLVDSLMTLASPNFANFTNLADGVYWFNASSEDSVGHKNDSATRNVTINVLAPSVNGLAPTSGKEYNYSEIIEISANTSDLFGVDSVLANLTMPNGTSRMIELQKVGSSNKYNNSFEIPALLGTYSITIISNDSYNRINDSETTYFAAVDRIVPVINLFNPGNGVNYVSTSQSVVFQYNVSDFNIANCSLIVNNAVANTSFSVNTSAGAINQFTNVFGVGSYSWNINCSDNNSNINASETRSFSVTAPVVTPPSEGGGGGGGGGGAPTYPAPTPKEEAEELAPISVNPEELSIMLVAGTGAEREITIRNLRNATISLSITVEGEVARILKAQGALSLGPNEEKVVKLTIDKAEKGLLTGKIVIRIGDYSKDVSVVINLKSENFLFDSALTIPDEYRAIKPGDDLVAQVNLLQVGPKEKVDVVATYVIKDLTGKKYLEETETFFVLDAKDYVKTFYTDNFPAGKYVLGLDIAYPGAFATSSAQFEILPTGVSKFSNQAIILITVLGAIGIGFLVWILRARRLLYRGLVKRGINRKV